jgi:hypothetical protein
MNKETKEFNSLMKKLMEIEDKKEILDLVEKILNIKISDRNLQKEGLLAIKKNYELTKEKTKNGRIN